MFISIELMYLVDFITQFLLEYTDQQSMYPVRDVVKTATRYLKSNEMILDLINLVPFAMIFSIKNGRLFFLLKCIRIFKSMKLLDTQAFMKAVKNFYGKQLKKKLEDKEIANDSDNDHNKIVLILAI